ncbi:hypothetical protein GCM10011574_18920 [Microbispora bryophytorum]|uniref:Uncharacterized protein n=1 Tax=Microbispora bryophytorum TaxID=1460882 RepID=A0A8H9H1H7_9ACTN|nr:hypothetical protein GCM10011574_18920 [Microbispora bryophytorum]
MLAATTVTASPVVLTSVAKAALMPERAVFTHGSLIDSGAAAEEAGAGEAAVAVAAAMVVAAVVVAVPATVWGVAPVTVWGMAPVTVPDGAEQAPAARSAVSAAGSTRVTVVMGMRKPSLGRPAGTRMAFLGMRGRPCGPSPAGRPLQAVPAARRGLAATAEDRAYARHAPPEKASTTLPGPYAAGSG